MPARKAGNTRQTPRNLNTGKKVQAFGELVNTEDALHRRFDEMDGQTIYITNIEPQKSDRYGEGYKVYFKDMPGERDTYTASCYGQYVVPQLKQLYEVTHNGGKLLPGTCVKTVIRQVGRTYKFE